MFSLFCLVFYVLFTWKYYKPIKVQYYIGNCVSWVPKLTSLDLWTHSQNGTHLYVGDFLYHQPGEKSNKDILCLREKTGKNLELSPPMFLYYLARISLPPPSLIMIWKIPLWKCGNTASISGHVPALPLHGWVHHSKSENSYFDLISTALYFINTYSVTQYIILGLHFCLSD